MSKEYKVISRKTICSCNNLIIEWNGWVYDVVYGQASDGYFLSVPNHQISCLISEPIDTLYNMGKIFRETNNETLAMIIATAIKEDWEENNEEKVRGIK